MSVIVYGMKMPEHCGYCRFRYDGICHALQKTQYSMEECPLVSVPPHGRLIDADAVTDAAMEDILGWEDAGCDRSDYRAFLDNYIEDAPTIIPAEEGER